MSANGWPKPASELRSIGYAGRECGKCRSFGRSVLWTITPRGKVTPMEEVSDGLFQSHSGTAGLAQRTSTGTVRLHGRKLR